MNTMELEELVDYTSRELHIELKQGNSHHEGESPDKSIGMSYFRKDKDFSLTKTHAGGKREEVSVKEIDREFEISYISFYGELAVLRFGNISGNLDPLLLSMNRIASKIRGAETRSSDYSSGVVVKHNYPSLGNAMDFIRFIVEGFKERAYTELVQGTN